MGIDVGYELKKQPFNVSWKRYGNDRNVTIPVDRLFPADSSFFAIGSCFANELRAALGKKGFGIYPKPATDVHHLFPKAIQRPASWGPWDDRVHLQFYNTFSLRQEFEKAFGLWTQAPDDYYTVVQAGETQYWDPYRRSIYADSLADIHAISQAQDATMKQGIMDADAIVITLGLIETFKRKNDGRVTCQYNRHFVDHVEYHQSTFAENYDNIKTICDLYFKAFPNKKIVLSVSPIALTQTFNDRDVVVANTESKSMLRTVAAEIDRNYENVIYWPSYEICMNNEGSFKSDLRHVTQERVDTIMEAFVHTKINTPNNDDTRRYWD